MRAHVELSDSERRILVTLDEEEREALVEQMLTSVREELEWEVAVERAHQAAAVAAAAATAGMPLPSPQPPPSPLPKMATTASRTRTPTPVPPRRLPPPTPSPRPRPTNHGRLSMDLRR
jgi:hypothetical protein